MKILYFKLFSLLLIFTLGNEIVTAQIMGKAGGNALNFFNTSANGGQIGHQQSGVFGTFTNTGRWIAIGQPAGVSTELYGMRIQDRAYNGTFSYNGSQYNKDLEIVFGTQSILSTSEDAFYQLPDLNFKTTTDGFSSTLRMRLTSQGTLAINSNYTGTFYKLYADGRAYSTVGWFSPSDARYKKDISAISNASEKLAQLKGVSYDFKKAVINGIDFSGHEKQLGFIAQDLEKVFPELVVQDEEGYYAVNYQGLIPVLVEGFNDQKNLISEQSELITEQETNINALNFKIENLEKQMLKMLEAINALEGAASLELTPKFSQDLNSTLGQNRPNPFKGLTTIDYELPANVQNAKLLIVNIEGQQIASYNVNGRKGSIDFDGSNLTAGTYFYSLIVNGDNLVQQKMIIQ